MFSQRFSWQVILLYLLLIACDTCSQVFFKSASAGLIEPEFDNWQHFLSFITSVAVQPEIAMGIVSLMVAFVCWMLLIRRNDLSKAHLVSCFVYATVPTASMMVFGDHIATHQLIGIALITSGALIAGIT